MMNDREFCVGCQRFIQKDDFIAKEDRCYHCVQRAEFRKKMEAKKKYELSQKAKIAVTI